MSSEKSTKENINVLVDKDVKKLVIERREGELNRIMALKKTEIEGTIKSVSEFIKHREFTKKQAHVLYSYKDMTIKLITEEASTEAGHIIKGKLEYADELKALDIFMGKGGTPTIYDSKKLAQILRFNKALFFKGEECDQLLDSIVKLKIKVEAVYEENQKERGNKSSLMNQKVDSAIPLDFILHTRVFKGYEKQKYKVNIHFDVRENQYIDFWFESVELAEIIFNEAQRIMDEELNTMKDYVRIQQ